MFSLHWWEEEEIKIEKLSLSEKADSDDFENFQTALSLVHQESSVGVGPTKHL